MERRRRRCSSSSCASFRPARRSWWRPALNRRSIFSKTCISRPSEIDWLARSGRFGPGLLDYLGESSLHRRCPRDAGRDGVLCQRADFARDRAVASGSARRNPADQYPAFPVADRLQSRPHGARGAGQAAGRFRPASSAWRRGRPHGRACELYRGIYRHGDDAGRDNGSESLLSARWRIRSSRPRRRNGSVRKISRNRVPRT